MVHRATYPDSSPRQQSRLREAPPAGTREKLLEAAGQVFAERGYYKATIREICHIAKTNVAAVNYTFGDKLGLYTEVLRECVRAPEMAQITAALDAAHSPEEVVRRAIHVRLKSLCARERPEWGVRIMMHEFSQPTPAMSRVVDGMRPVYTRMLKALGAMLGLPPEHEKTRLCNNSIFGQVLFYAFSQPVLSRLQPELKLTPEQVERIADHITEFSLAYLKQMRQQEHQQAESNSSLAMEFPEKNNGCESQAHDAQHKSRV